MTKLYSRFALLLVLFGCTLVPGLTGQTLVNPQFFGMTISQNAGVTFPNLSPQPIEPHCVRAWDSATGWADIETSAGVYNWTKLDTFIANAGGNCVLWTIGKTPQFYSPVSSDSSCAEVDHSCDGVNDVAANGTGADAHFQAFITAAFARYGTKIQYIELWNEANNVQFCTNAAGGGTALSTCTAQALLRMLYDAKAIYTSATFTAPSMCVCNNTVFTSSTSTATNSADGVAYFLAASIMSGAVTGANTTPIVATHQYVGNNPAANISGALTNVRSAMTTAGVGSLPLWVTENSWGLNTTQTAWGPCSSSPPFTQTCMDNMAAFVGQSELIAAGKAVAEYFWYAWGNQTHGTLYDESSGLLLTQGIAWKNVRRLLQGTTITVCSNASTVWTCAVTGPGSFAGEWVWDTSQTCTPCTTSTFTVPSPLQGGSIFDLAGDPGVESGPTTQIGIKPVLLTNSAITISTLGSAPVQSAAPVTLSATITNLPSLYSCEFYIDNKRWIETYTQDQHPQYPDYPDAWQGACKGLWYPGLAGDGFHSAMVVAKDVAHNILAQATTGFTVDIEGMSNQYVNAMPNLSGNQVSGTGKLGVITFDGTNNGLGPYIDGYLPSGITGADPLYTACGYAGGTSQPGGGQIPNLVTTCFPNGLHEVYVGYRIGNIADPYIIPLTFTRSGNNISFTCTNTAGCHDSYQGSVVTFSTTGTLPAPLIAGCQYYWTTSASNPSNTATVSISGGTLTATLSSGCNQGPGTPVYIRNIQKSYQTGSATPGVPVCDGYYTMATGSGTSFTVTGLPSACNGAGSNQALEIDVNPYFAIYVDANDFEVSASCSPCVGLPGTIAPGSALTLTSAGSGTQTVTQRIRSDYWTGSGSNGAAAGAVNADWASNGGPAYTVHSYDFENGNAPMQLHPLYWEMHLVAGASATPLCSAATLIQNTDLSFISTACNASGISWTASDYGPIGNASVATVDGSGNVTPVGAGWMKITLACSSCATGSVSLPSVVIYVQVHSGSVTFPQFTTCGVIAQAFDSGLPSGCNSFHPHSQFQTSVSSATPFNITPAQRPLWLGPMFTQSGFNSAIVGTYIGSNILDPTKTSADTWGATNTQLYYEEQFAATNNIYLEYDMYSMWFQSVTQINGTSTNILSLAAILNNTGYNREASLTALVSHMVSNGRFWRIINDDEVNDYIGNFLQPDPAIGGANWTNAIVSGTGITFTMVNPPTLVGTNSSQVTPSYSQSTGIGSWISITGATNTCLNGWYPILSGTSTQWTTNNNGSCGNGTYTSGTDPTAKMTINPSQLGTPNSNNQQNVSALPGALGQGQTCWSGCGTGANISSLAVTGTCIITVNWPSHGLSAGTGIRIWGATSANLNTVSVVNSSPAMNSFTITYAGTSQQACPTAGPFTSSTDPNLYITVDPGWPANPLGTFYSYITGVANHPARSWSVLGSFFSPGTPGLASFEQDPAKTDSAFAYIPAPPTPIYGFDASVHDWMTYSNSSSGILSRPWQTTPRAMLISIGYVGGGNASNLCPGFSFNPGCDRPAQLDWRPEGTIAEAVAMKTLGVSGDRIYNFYQDTDTGYAKLCCGWAANAGFAGGGLNPFVDPKQWAAIARFNALTNLRTDTELQPEANKPYLGPFFQTDAHTSATYGNELTILSGSESPCGSMTVNLPQISGGKMLKYYLMGTPATLYMTVLPGNPTTDTDDFCAQPGAPLLASPGRTTTYVALPASPATQPIDTPYFPPPTLPGGATSAYLRFGYWQNDLHDGQLFPCTYGCQPSVDHHNTPIWYQWLFANSSGTVIGNQNPTPSALVSQGLP